MKMFLFFSMLFGAGLAVISGPQSIGSSSPSHNAVLISYPWSNTVVVESGKRYRFPLSLSDWIGEVPFEVTKFPIGSSLVVIDNKQYIEWSPFFEGGYYIELTCSHPDKKGWAQKSYAIVVKGKGYFESREKRVCNNPKCALYRQIREVELYYVPELNRNTYICPNYGCKQEMVKLYYECIKCGKKFQTGHDTNRCENCVEN